MTRSKFNLSIRIFWIEVLFTLLSLVYFFLPLHGQKLSNEFISVVGHSNFVFYGSVIYEDSSNINAHTTDKTSIVKVDEVLNAAEPFLKMKGREITVLLADSTIHKPGIQSVFYTRGWYYGKTLGVREVQNNFYNSFSPDLKSRILAARDKIKENLLISQLKRSTLIIQGKVLRTDIDTLKNYYSRSEHNPKLKAAILEIKRSIKGNTPAATVLVYYASSFDIMWENSPKLQKNMEAVFILHQGRTQPILQPTDYYLFDPRDLQPYDQARRIKKLLKN